MTAPVLGCKWCGKKLGAKFDRVCKDCGHSMYLHRHDSATALPACSVGSCACTARYSMQYEPQERTSEQFPRKRIGYGVDALGLFCTKDCACRWAHKYAAAIQPHRS